MADQSRKDQTKDLPLKTVPKSDADKVKGGGSHHINSRKRPADLVNG